jgi:hypothetical protein
VRPFYQWAQITHHGYSLPLQRALTDVGASSGLWTLRTAARLQTSTVLERSMRIRHLLRGGPNGSAGLPCNHEHAFNADVLHKEEEEFRLAVTDFVVRTFLNEGFAK